jgi:hypothetical protein
MSLHHRLGLLGVGTATLLLAVLPGGGRTSVPPTAGAAMTTAGRATVRGRVTLEGPAPDIDTLTRDFLNARTLGRDSGVCEKAPAEENQQQTWRIDEEGGVANVVVWLRPADGSHFVMEKEDLHPQKRTWAPEVVVDQLHLNFTPRVIALFPSHFDPAKKQQIPTGQAFKIRNSSRVACSAKTSGGPENPGDNVLLLPDKEWRFELRPERRVVVLNDSIHPWMQGYAWAFDHPYAAVTDRAGRYEIRKVPTGGALRLMAWHEQTGYLYGRDGVAVELKDGDNRKDLRIRAAR